MASAVAVDNAKKEFDGHPTLEQCDRNDNVMAVEQGLISRGDREAWIWKSKCSNSQTKHEGKQ